VGLFKRTDSAAAEPEVAPPPEVVKGPAKKTVATPTRRQAEQARRDRIQPTLTPKQAKAREREARYKERGEAEAKIHARPVNTMCRDWVDRRWNLIEFILPVMLLLFVGSIVGSGAVPLLVGISAYLIWGVFILVILDMTIMWMGLRRQLRTHFPSEPLKGKFRYVLSRAMLMRRSRVPAPRVKRGTKFVWPPAEDR